MKKFLLLTLFPPMALLLSSCEIGQSTAQVAVPEVVRPAKIVTLDKRVNPLVRSFPGTIQAARKSDLAFRVAGQLVELPVVGRWGAEMPPVAWFSHCEHR